MSYKPEKNFTGSSSNLDATGTAGIDYLNADNDEVRKMFDPDSTHEDGSPGGIHKDNIMKTDSGIPTEDDDGDVSITRDVIVGRNFVGPVIGNVTGNVTGNCSGSSGSCTGNSATATQIGGSTGGKWVEVVNSSVSVNNAGETSINLRPGGQHNLYMYSVYSSGTSKLVYQSYVDSTYLAGNSAAKAVVIQKSTGNDILMISNNTGGVLTFYYKVWVWE